MSLLGQKCINLDDWQQYFFNYHEIVTAPYNCLSYVTNSC